MLGDGYETGQVPLFHVFVRIFGLDHAQNMPLFREDNQSNPSIKLCATNLRTRAKRKQKIVQGHGNSTSIATTLFSLLKVLRFHNQSLD